MLKACKDEMEGMPIAFCKHLALQMQQVFNFESGANQRWCSLRISAGFDIYRVDFHFHSIVDVLVGPTVKN